MKTPSWKGYIPKPDGQCIKRRGAQYARLASIINKSMETPSWKGYIPKLDGQCIKRQGAQCARLASRYYN